jgi:hypothetical protein
MTKLKKTYKKKYYGGMNTNQWAAAFTYQINNPGSSVYIKHKETGEIRKISTNIGRGERFNTHQLNGNMGNWDIYVKNNNGNYYQIGGNSAQFPNLISVDVSLFTNKLVENYFLTKHSLKRMSPSNSPSDSPSASSSSSAVSRITSTYAGGGQPPLDTARAQSIHKLTHDLQRANIAVNNLSNTVTSQNIVTPLNIDAAHSNTVATVASSNTAAAAAASSQTDDNARLLLLRSQLEQLQGPTMAKQIIKVVSIIIVVIAIGGAIWYKFNLKKGGNPTPFSYEKFFENPTLHGCALFFEKLNEEYTKLIPISNADFKKLNKKGGRQNTRKKTKNNFF